jgi:hypothetical protein
MEPGAKPLLGPSHKAAGEDRTCISVPVAESDVASHERTLVKRFTGSRPDRQSTPGERVEHLVETQPVLVRVDQVVCLQECVCVGG